MGRFADTLMREFANRQICEYANPQMRKCADALIGK